LPEKSNRHIVFSSYVPTHGGRGRGFKIPIWNLEEGIAFQILATRFAQT
jgi:hypothetical protein